MDQFINAAYLLAIELLPILGVVVLIILIVVLSKVIKLINKLIGTLDRGTITLDLVDKSIEKIQSPLDTAVKVSGTVDEVHDVTVKAVKDSAAYLRKNKDQLKNKVDEFVNKKKKNSEPTEMNDVI